MAIRLICEKDNFYGSTTKAAEYYYPRWKYEVMDFSQIRDELIKRFGHNEDFADEVIELVLDKYDDDQRYWDEYDDYDESVSRKRKQSKRLKEDSLDDFQGDSEYDIDYIHKDYVPSLKSVARAAARGIGADDSKVIIKWEPMDSEVDGMGTLIVGYPGTSGIGFYIQSNVYNYAVDSGIIGKYYDQETGEPCNLFNRKFKENYKYSAKTKSSRRIKEDSWDTSNPYSYENLESDAKRCFKQGNYIVSDVIDMLFRNWYKKKEIYKIIMANLDILDLGELDDESFIEQEIEDQAMMY